MPFSSRVLTSASTTSITLFLVFLASTILGTVSQAPNLALTGTASQICDFEGGSWTADFGIDGIIEEGENGNMFVTCNSPSPTWWEVELPGDSTITTIAIWNRLNYFNRLGHSEIQVFNEAGDMVHTYATDTYESWNAPTMTLDFETPIVGNRVRIQKLAPTDTDNSFVLNLKEVQVFGSPTLPPTQAPTATAAAVGSFEIHSTGNVTGTAISGTAIALLATYNASNRVHNTTVLSRDCITPFPADVAEAFTVTTTEPMSLGEGFIAYNSTIKVDISKVNTTDPWKPLSDGVNGGVLDLCLESAIFLKLEGKNEKMNFVNTNLTLTVEMDANFEVTTINAERKDATQEKLNLDYSDYVTAYECVESDLVNKANDQEYSQGDELKICVKSKDPTIVQVGGIQRLTLSQDDDATDDDFTYINGGNPVSSEIAATTCDKTITPAHVCHADMQLLGRYFEDESPGELTATGSVKLSFPDGSERRLTVDVPIASGIRGGDLALENSARHMEEEKPDDSPFDVTVSLKSSPDGSGGTNDFNGATLLSGMVGAVGGAILMA